MEKFNIKKKKLNTKSITEIKAHRENREDLYSFLYNFVKNITNRSNCLMPSFENFNSDNKDTSSNTYLQTSNGLYISSLVTCWETFFRDLFIFLVEEDADIQERVFKLFKEKQIEISNEDYSMAELASKQFNFQNLEDTCTALNFLFNKNKTNITSFIYPALKNTTYIFSELNYFLHLTHEKKDVATELYKVLVKAFDIRHKVIHDANFYPTLSLNELKIIEDCFVIFPQILASWVAKIYNLKNFVYSNHLNTLSLKQEIAKGESIYIFSIYDVTKAVFTVSDHN
ncbi:hypothetical protein ACS75_26885 [Bacillus thuringiensis]|nr:hypothetical protein ACS75_26885 [Bacillus thuringiensis]